MGGMGEQCRQIVKRLSHQCVIVDSTQSNKTRVPIGISDPLVVSFLTQANFVGSAVEHDFDLVHAFDWSTFYAGCVLAEQRRVPLVVTVQLSISQLGQSLSPSVLSPVELTAAGIELMGLTRADRIIQVSQSYSDSFPSIFTSKTTVITNGIDNQEWEKPRQFQLPGTRRHKVVFIGRLAYQKGVHLLLQSEIPSDVDLIYIGGNRGSNTELVDEVVRQSKERDGVHYLGPLYGEDKIGALQAADAIVMPSIHEPFGIVALEALASRSILLSSFANGMSDFLTEDVAINCGATTDSISAAMQRVVVMSDCEKRDRVSKGLEICKHHDWDRIANQLESVYDQVLQSRTEKAA